MPMSRRRFLAAGLATAAATGAVPPAFGQAAAQKLTATTRNLDVNGKAARVYGLIGPGGKPGVHAGAGRTLSHRSRQRDRGADHRPLARADAALEG